MYSNKQKPRAYSLRPRNIFFLFKVRYIGLPRPDVTTVVNVIRCLEPIGSLLQGSGKMKSLLIGINYTGQGSYELKGCHNDVSRIQSYLKTQVSSALFFTRTMILKRLNDRRNTHHSTTTLPLLRSLYVPV